MCTTSTKETQVYHTPDGAPYVICKSDKPFRNPTSDPAETPELVIGNLNVDLGQTLITRKNTTLLWVIDFLDKVVFRWWERVFFYLWGEVVPLRFRRTLTFASWKLYLKLHKMLLGKRTGLHQSQSFEYHALTTIVWWGRIFNVSPRRMRFFLSQLHVIAPNPPPPPCRIEAVCESPDLDALGIPLSEVRPEARKVKGWYIYRHDKSKPTEKVIFWLYGGAYLAGDVRGNSATADWVGQQCDMDVFVPHTSLAPEHSLDEILWDVCLAYKWFTSRIPDPSKQVYIWGISSGGATATRLMQLISQYSRGEPTGLPNYFNPLFKDTPLPTAGILFGPYVDYEPNQKGSFLHYPRLDLIVTESVQENGLPYLDTCIPKHMENPRREYSPVHRSLKGLPPLCVVVSEHEAVYDMAIQLVNRGRSEGVSVTVAVFKYMCHVFSFLQAFIPEGQISMDYVCDWIREHAKLGK